MSGLSGTMVAMTNVRHQYILLPPLTNYYYGSYCRTGVLKNEITELHTVKTFEIVTLWNEIRRTRFCAAPLPTANSMFSKMTFPLKAAD